MMTAQSIPAASAPGYADYLHARTRAPALGDYYLGADGAPAEASGRWLTPADALQRVGVHVTETVSPDDLRALMAGRRPGTETQAAQWRTRRGGRRARPPAAQPRRHHERAARRRQLRGRPLAARDAIGA